MLSNRAPVQAAAQQLGAEAYEGGAFRRGLVSGKATEPAKAGPVVESFGQAHVGKVVPGCQQEGSEQGQRWPARLTLGRGRDAGKQVVQLRPVHQGRNFVQRRAAAWLSAAQRQLLLPDLTSRHGPPPTRSGRHGIRSGVAKPATRTQVSSLGYFGCEDRFKGASQAR